MMFDVTHFGPDHDPVLATKFFIPRRHPTLIPRPRLVEQLNQGIHRKLTLISAPAGFGKTTLLVNWIADFTKRADLSTSHERHIETQRSAIGDLLFAWVSLDESDND